MDAPDDLIEAVAMAMSDADGTRDGSGHLPQCELVEAELWPIYEAYADAVLSVPGIADALARDAKVAEWIERLRGRGADVFSVVGSIAALYPEAGK